MDAIILNFFESIINQTRRLLAPVRQYAHIVPAPPIIQLLKKMKNGHFNGSPRVPGEADLMTKRLVAEMLGKTERTIDLWRKLLGLPSYKLGHSVYFKKSEVLAFVEKHKAGMSLGP